MHEDNLIAPAKQSDEDTGLVGPDPMTAGGDPLAGPKSSSDPMAGDDQMLPRTYRTTTTPGKVRLVSNWYWMGGGLSNGSVSVKVNGIELGQFAVNFATEITDDLHKGTNQVEFTTHPDLPSIPVTGGITIIYSQQPAGALPVLSYNADPDPLGGTSATEVTPSDSVPKPAQSNIPAAVRLNNHTPGNEDSNSTLDQAGTASPQDSSDQESGSKTQTLTFIAE